MSFGLGIGQYLALFLYLTMVGAAVISVAGSPRIGLYLLVLSLPLQTTRYKVQGYPLGDSWIDVLLVTVLIGGLLRYRLDFPKSLRINAFVFAAVVLLYISLFYGALRINSALPVLPSDDRFADWKNSVVVMPLLYVATFLVIRTALHARILLGIMGVSCLLVAKGFASSISGRSFEHFSYALRDAGPLGFAGVNGLGAFEAQMAVFFLSLALIHKSMWHRIACLTIVVVNSACLLYTLSRGAYLGILVGFAAIAIFRKRLLLLPLGILMFSWSFWAPAAAVERLAGTYDENAGLEESAQERVTLWADAQKLIAESPVIGFGYNTYAYMGRVGAFRDTHNYYVKLLVELGAVGLIGFLILLGKFFRVGFRLYSRTCEEESDWSSIGFGFAMMIPCLLTLNFFGDRWHYIEINGFLWCILALSARGYAICAVADPTGRMRAEFGKA